MERFWEPKHSSSGSPFAPCSLPSRLASRLIALWLQCSCTGCGAVLSVWFLQAGLHVSWLELEHVGWVSTGTSRVYSKLVPMPSTTETAPTFPLASLPMEMGSRHVLCPTLRPISRRMATSGARLQGCRVTWTLDCCRSPTPQSRCPYPPLSYLCPCTQSRNLGQPSVWPFPNTLGIWEWCFLEERPPFDACCCFGV